MTLGVMLAHGSPDPRSAACVRAAAMEVSSRCGFGVLAAFLDHDSPTLADAVASVPAAEPVVVLPLLLSSAFHARVDVPAAAAALDRRVVLLDPLGHPGPVLDAVLLRGRPSAVVVAAGTKVDEERAAFADAVASSSTRTGVAARAVFATGPGPKVVDAAPGTAVVPWLLAPGRLLDSVHERAADVDLDVVGGPLLDEPLLLEAVAARILAASLVP